MSVLLNYYSSIGIYRGIYDIIQVNTPVQNISTSKNIDIMITPYSTLAPVKEKLLYEIRAANYHATYIMHVQFQPLYNNNTYLYTTYRYKLNNVEDNINNELICISNWFKANKLLLNLKKTNCCVFHNNCRDMSTLENISLAIDSIPISKVNVNFLGIQIDSDLK